MNKAKKTELVKLAEKIEEILSEVEDMQEEEQEKYNNIPENLGGSKSAEKLEEVIDKLEEVKNGLCDAKDAIWEIVE